MDKNLKIANKVLKTVYIIGAIIFTVPLLFDIIFGWISYIFNINVLGADFHQFFGIAGSQLSTYQFSWIMGQAIFSSLLFISIFFVNKTWWFYYIWLVLVIEFIITNLQRLNLLDLFFWLPLMYTIILYLVNRRIKKV
jgi:hypothetical protein